MRYNDDAIKDILLIKLGAQLDVGLLIFIKEFF